MNLAKLAHDLRSPLARARTMTHLLEEATPEELREYRQLLAEALDEAEALVRQLESGSISTTD